MVDDMAGLVNARGGTGSLRGRRRDALLLGILASPEIELIRIHGEKQLAINR